MRGYRQPHNVRCLGILALLLMLVGRAPAQEGDTFSPLQDNNAPTNWQAMWDGFDPRAEPLEVETLHEWEQDGVTLRVVRFRIGVFKGQKASLAAVYGFPKGATNLPGLVQIHGGGQYADHKACLHNARRGYATVSIAWAGRISAPDYRVSPAEVKLFWDGKTDDPAYRLTTDWGAVDGYHAPGRNPGNQFPSARPAAWTLDPVESPRNSGWFLCAVAARRALTFLEQQPEVDPDRLGVYGHSMGGKLTVLTAPDPRVKAAAPSCGGISDRYNDSPLFRRTLGDDVALKQVTCPIIFLSPANDFHGRIGNLPDAVDEIQSDQWRVTCSPHHNHQDTAPYEVATQLWFDQHLKGTFAMPATLEMSVTLQTPDGIPAATVQADTSLPIASVDVFYTQQGRPDETPADRDNTVHRYWRHVATRELDGRWTAALPLASTDRPLWAYANVTYELPSPVTAAGYYYRTYTAETFNLSSQLQTFSPQELQAAGVRATLEPTTQIEDFEGAWQKEWFTYRPEEWGRSTNKLNDDLYRPPPDALLVLEVQADQTNRLVVVIDGFAAEVPLQGGDQWRTVQLTPGDFRNLADDGLPGWEGIRQLTLTASTRLRPARGDRRKSRLVGGNWKGDPPRFRNLRWQTVSAAATSVDRTPLLNVFPPSTFGIDGGDRGGTTFITEYTPSGSIWDERLDERQVFHIEMQHQQDEDRSFQLRIGRGGQIYSLRGPFGESVPPSWRAPGGHVSPWNDEVWQFVAVCTRYNGLDAIQKAGPVPEVFARRLKESGYRDLFFIHNSGAYIPGDADLQSLYCPLLAAERDDAARSYRMLNWGLIPQIRTIHRSPLLYYTQVRDAGDGVIELTWVVHNFSVRDDIVFDHLNAPWGGTRISSLPLRYVSSPDGRLLEREGFLSRHGTVDVRRTGGWNISCASDAPDSPSLALVYGRDRHLERERALKEAGKPYCQFRHSLYRDWRASEPLYRTRWKDWATRPENSFRNYDVCEIIPKLRIAPGTTIWFRSYLVVGRRDQVREQATALVDHVDYGLLQFEPDTTPMKTVSPGESEATFAVFTRPVAGTLPLFAIRNTTTGRQVITTDPYLFVEQEELSLELPEDHPYHDYFASAVGYAIDRNHSDWQTMIGFACEERPATGNWQRLSELLDAETFPPADRFHRDLWVKVVPASADDSRETHP
ncbi:dienelactone hydrolase family protein [Maioricimonas sp. JC845]|uniref:dienelactone hydrolase family protein n=1 Tax=Maioricimonas sp. JC845 TaxID=3232138 RepID=UPI00345774BF